MKTDISTYKLNEEGQPDLDPTFAIIAGRRVTAEHIARRIETDLGAIEEDPSYGFNLARQVSRRMSAAVEFEIRSGIIGQCLLEEGVESAEVQLIVRTGGWLITIELTDADGPFAFELEIDAVTGSVLLGKAPE
jgi:hypothetical protein